MNLTVLKEIRKIRGYTQKELASLCCIECSYLSKIENGKLLPSLYALKRILDVLEVDLVLGYRQK